MLERAGFDHGGSGANDLALSVRNLTIEFDLGHTMLRAVDDVDFALHRGQTLCIVGESGSGKSMTARAILRIVPPPGRVVSGSMVFTPEGPQGRSVDLALLPPKSARMRSVRGREIAMIFQEPMTSLSPIHRIGWQIAEAMIAHGLCGRAAAERRAVELLRQVEIPSPETAVRRYPFEFSGGMRQRAMIAMALACEPKILIADEPTTALDVTTQAEILRLLRRLQDERGLAVLFITHDMGVVAQIARDVVVMQAGRLVERAPVGRLFAAPEHPYTQRLLASARKLGMAAPPARTGLAARGAGLLQVRDLVVSFPGERRALRRPPPPVRAVDRVSFDLAEGENLGIVGESGSGKTTLGNALLRVLRPDAGTIAYRERDGTVTDLATAGRGRLLVLRRQIRMVFQDPFASLNPRMTVGQIVGEPLLVNGILSGQALRRRVEELLELVDLPPAARTRYPHAFSGGQRQRIVIARALALEPRLVIADEPTSALDVTLRSQILDLLLALQARLGLSFIFISHDLGVVRYFCDRVLVMHRGRVVEQGSTAQICGAPREPYTRALLAAVPEADPQRRNLLRGRASQALDGGAGCASA